MSNRSDDDDGEDGQTGVKLAADYYESSVPIGGGALSGRDRSHVDRIGARLVRQPAMECLVSRRGEAPARGERVNGVSGVRERTGIAYEQRAQQGGEFGDEQRLDAGVGAFLWSSLKEGSDLGGVRGHVGSLPALGGPCIRLFGRCLARMRGGWSASHNGPHVVSPKSFLRWRYSLDSKH